MPDSFFRKQVKELLNYDLGPLGSYGCGIVFTPKSDAAVNAIKDVFKAHANQCGFKIIGWRKIETGKKKSFIFNFL
jgi:glutamate synthase (NADPH/NADH) large chain